MHKLTFILILFASTAFAQKRDSVKIDPSHPTNPAFVAKMKITQKRDSLAKSKKQPARKPQKPKSQK